MPIRILLVRSVLSIQNKECFSLVLLYCMDTRDRIEKVL